MALAGCEQRKPAKTCRMDFKQRQAVMKPTRKQMQRELVSLKAMLSGPCSPACCEKYIIDVIDNGSDVLGFPSSPMDPGFAAKEDAPAIAAYAVTLSGKKSPHPEQVETGSLLFAGNCAGCHGSDGKGNHGAFPDLTLPELKGMTLKKRQLAARVRELEKRLND